MKKFLKKLDNIAKDTNVFLAELFSKKNNKSDLVLPMKYGVFSGGKRFRSAIIVNTGKIFNIKYKKSNHISYSKIGIIITTLISVILAIFFKDAIKIWYITGSFAVSSIMIPILCCIYNKKIARPTMLISIPFCMTGIWFILGLAGEIELFQSILPSIISGTNNLTARL